MNRNINICSEPLTVGCNISVLCLHVPMHTYIRTYARTHTHTCAHVRTHEYMHVCMQAHTHAYIICVRSSIPTYVYAIRTYHIRKNLQNACTYSYIQKHANTHVCTDTQCARLLDAVINCYSRISFVKTTHGNAAHTRFFVHLTHVKCYFVFKCFPFLV